MQVRIVVKEPHVAAGVPRSTLACPIVLAVNEKLNPGYRARVGVDGRLCFDHEDRELVSVRLPKNVMEFGGSFDMGLPHKLPVWFDVDIPAECVKPKEPT